MENKKTFIKFVLTDYQRLIPMLICLALFIGMAQYYFFNPIDWGLLYFGGIVIIAFLLLRWEAKKEWRRQNA